MKPGLRWFLLSRPPPTEITEYVAECYDNIYSEWAPNEKVATEVVSFGAAAGSKGLQRYEARGP